MTSLYGKFERRRLIAQHTDCVLRVATVIGGEQDLLVCDSSLSKINFPAVN